MSNQKPRDIDEQISLLRKKGMTFSEDDIFLAKEYFSRISYFRLKYYWKDYIDLETEGDFVTGVSFSDIIQRYDFDQNLKSILFEAIGIIEIALRSKIINHMSKAAGNGLWYLDASLFENKEYHEDFVYDLKSEFGRCTEPFAREYINSHPDWNESSTDGDNPDAWKIIEAATFGTLSKMYKNLRSQLPQKAAIANDFGLYSTRDLSGWLEAISIMRNIVAHYSRLWNRTLSKKVTNPKSISGKWLKTPLSEGQTNRPYAVIVAVLHLCNVIYPSNTIKQQLLNLINAHKTLPIKTLGFTSNWQDNPIWK